MLIGLQRTSRVKLFFYCLSRKKTRGARIQFSSCVTPFSYLTEILSGDAVVITAGQLVHECEHLVFGSDELWLGGTAQEGKLRWLPKAQASKVNKNTRGQNMWNCNSCNKPYYTAKCVSASWLQAHIVPHRGIWSPTRGKVILLWLHFSLSPPHSHQIERSGAFLCEVQTQKVL